MVYIVVLSFVLATVITFSYLHYARRKRWLDIPNARSSHTQLTPRGGGSGFLLLTAKCC